MGFKFRSIKSQDKRSRYQAPTGQAHRMFNVRALVNAVDTILASRVNSTLSLPRLLASQP